MANVLAAREACTVVYHDTRENVAKLYTGLDTFGVGEVQDVSIVLYHVHFLYALYGIYSKFLERAL